MTGHAYAYQESCREPLADVSWHALIFAAMRRADTINAEILRAAFPQLWAELQARYDAPGGRLPGD
jgi:hypothetical protein